jgi:hypothetical protein
LAENFSDDLLYPHTSVTYDNRVLVSLMPFAYECGTCEAKGFVPRLAEAFTQRLRPTWCSDCMTLTEARWARQRELAPRLYVLLARTFTVERISPGNAASAVIVSG